MKTITNPMTAPIPSAFGGLVYGCAHTAVPMTVAPTAVVAGESSVLRDRQVVFAGSGLDQGTRWGTPAWRPPIC